MGGSSIADFAGSITVEALEADPYPIYARLRRHPRLSMDPRRPPVFRGWEFRAPRRLDVLLA